MDASVWKPASWTCTASACLSRTPPLGQVRILRFKFCILFFSICITLCVCFCFVLFFSMFCLLSFCFFSPSPRGCIETVPSEAGVDIMVNLLGVFVLVCF